MSASRALALTLSCVFCCVCNPCHADNHPPYTYEWMASEAALIAIGKFEESKRVMSEDEQKGCSTFVSRVRVLYLFKGSPKIQSLTVVHHRWARENTLPLANPMFAKIPREMATALDAIDIGESADVSKYRGLFLMFLRQCNGKYFPVTGPAWENYAIQLLSGNFDHNWQKEELADKENRHKTPPEKPKEDDQ